jgi:hypothetical protein
LHGTRQFDHASSNAAANRNYISTGNYVNISRALRYHKIDGRFTEIERFVRDEFDWFLFRIGVFGQLIKLDIISYEEIDGHLNYVIDLIRKRKSELTAALELYMKEYSFSLAAFVLEQRKEYLEKENQKNQKRDTKQARNLSQSRFCL